jgi:hypothetical protein
VPPPRQLRVSNLDLLIALMDLERYKDLLFAGEQTDRAAGEDAAGGCSAQAEHSAVHSIPERRHGAEPVERGRDEAPADSPAGRDEGGGSAWGESLWHAVPLALRIDQRARAHAPTRDQSQTNMHARTFTFTPTVKF